MASSIPKATWQDLLTVGGLVLGYAAMNAEDTFFLCIYALGGMVLVLLAIRRYAQRTVLIRRSFYVLAILTTAVISYRTYARNLERELSQNQGALIPANLPSPLSKCPIPYDALAIYFGGSVSWARRFPHTVFRGGSIDLVTIDKTGDGITITAKIFDDRSNLIAELKQNNFISTNYASHFKRDNLSTLIVYDHRGDVALDVTYLNERAITIKGILRIPDNPTTAVVSDKDILLMPGSNILGGQCGGEIGGADFHF